MTCPVNRQLPLTNELYYIPANKSSGLFGTRMSHAPFWVGAPKAFLLRCTFDTTTGAPKAFQYLGKVRLWGPEGVPNESPICRSPQYFVQRRELTSQNQTGITDCDPPRVTTWVQPSLETLWSVPRRPELPWGLRPLEVAEADRPRCLPLAPTGDNGRFYSPADSPSPFRGIWDDPQNIRDHPLIPLALHPSPH